MLRPGGAGADVALLEDRDVRDPVIAEVVRGRQAVRAAADDHHVVGALQRPAGGATSAACGRCQARAASCAAAGRKLGQRVDADRAAAEVVAGVGDDRPHVLADRPPEQDQVPVLGLADHDARLARDRARAQRADGRHLRPQVDRAEAGEDLSRASGPTIVSAANAASSRRRRRCRPPALQRSRVLGGPPITSARVAVSRHHQASSLRAAVPNASGVPASCVDRVSSCPGARACARCEMSAHAAVSVAAASAPAR